MKRWMIIALLGLVACERQIPLKNIEFEQKLVINSLNTSDQFIHTYVGSSVNSVNIPELDDVRGDALVLLKEDDFVVFYDTVIIHNGLIPFNVVAEKGKTYQFEMALDGYPSIRAVDSVPLYNPQLRDLEIFDQSDRYQVRLSIDDVPLQTRYMLEILIEGYMVENGDTVYHERSIDFYSSDKVFVTNINTVNKASSFALMDDVLFADRTWTLDVNLARQDIDQLDIEPTEVKVRMSCISEAMYDYYLGILENNHIYGGPLAMRALNNGNVIQGLGLFSFRTLSEETISLP